MIDFNLFNEIVDYIREKFPNKDRIFLHEPVFIGNEKDYICEAIDSTFVSSVGDFVNKGEQMMCDLTGSSFAVATVNGSSALHTSLLVVGVNRNDEVLTQSLTFIATCNAINYTGAHPIFLDVDMETLGMSPKSLRQFLHQNAEMRKDGHAYNKGTGKRIKACVPMHTFGFPCKIDEIAAICLDWNITLIEDSAESLGSYFNEKHTGTFGDIGVFSFNGNKTVTSGGGGMIVTNNEEYAKRSKHLTTQAKVPHQWEFVHDLVAYNYRMPNINAALLCGQLENLEMYVQSKRKLSEEYFDFFKSKNIRYVEEPARTKANYWLNSIFLDNRKQRDEFLKYTNERGVMTRPSWELMHRLRMFNSFQCTRLENSEWIADRLVNIPSSVRINNPI